MIVICEECGKKYRIEPAKIKGRAARFKCRVCAHLIVVSKPNSPATGPAAPQSAAAPESVLPAIPQSATESQAKSEFAPSAVDGDARTAPSDAVSGLSKPAKTAVPNPRLAKWLHLRTKMTLLFLLIPLIFMAGASLLYTWQLGTATEVLVQESSKVVNQIAEEKIANISAAVALQCKLYLLSHPELQKEAFNKDTGFRSLAVQKVGQTGYTALYQLPGSDGVWRTWAHVQSKIIGIDMMVLETSLKENFAGFWNIFSGVKGGQTSRGYYTWMDKDGRLRDKYMVCTPVAETPFVVAATAYLDEFAEPVRMVESKAIILAGRARMITWAILGATLLLFGILVAFYSHRLTGRIKSLTEVAKRISLGELELQIETKSKDEIGELAEAIARMRDSIRPSIERLRRRR